MTDDPMDSPHGSREARYVFSYLDRRGGSLRLRPLLRGLAIDPRIFIDAVNELNQRYWITIIWHKPTPGTPDDETRPLKCGPDDCSEHIAAGKLRLKRA